ncbi:peptidase [Streptococcus thermophilus 1F8CT]|nr:peptidase [Streptococcus thermophilus 1F8CT]
MIFLIYVKECKKLQSCIFLGNFLSHRLFLDKIEKMEGIMTQSGNLKFHTPIFRVNNRQENIDFYQNTLGFKLLTEENALAVFTDWSECNSLFVIEESPAYRCRAVEGPKKINKVVIKVSNPLEIEYLLARDDNQAKAIFQGENGYAFETISPENDLILVHAEDDLSTLKTVEYADVEEKKILKEFQILLFSL